MNRPITRLRLAGTLALAALASTAVHAFSPLPLISANQASDTVEQVAQTAEEEIERIDPTTGRGSLVVDPSLPTPYGITVEPLALEPFEPGLPPLQDEPGSVDDVTTLGSAPATDPLYGRRASRMISDPVVQSVPAPTQTRRTVTQEYPAESTPQTYSSLPPAPRVVTREVPMVSAPVVQDLPPEPRIAVNPQIPVSNDPFVIKSILPIEGTIRYGDWFWDESRAPASGKLVITVDLDARVISVFRDGHEIGTAVALLGTQKHPTPLGTFPILTKEKDNISEKYNNAPMPWTLRLTWDGIAIHGSPVINGYASHGCVGVPDPFAERLFAIASRGDKVVITRGKLVGMGDKLL